jgi:hypothetical protein
MATMDEDKPQGRVPIFCGNSSMKTEIPDHKEIYQILDFAWVQRLQIRVSVGCRHCKDEVRILQHWYDKHGVPFRTWLIAYISTFNKIGSYVPVFYNFFLKNKTLSNLIKRTIGFATERSIPLVHKTSLKRWAGKNLSGINPAKPAGSVCFFVDEFTNYNDTPAGIAVMKLLTGLNYKVIVVNHDISARTFISKGLVERPEKLLKKYKGAVRNSKRKHASDRG